MLLTCPLPVRPGQTAQRTVYYKSAFGRCSFDHDNLAYRGSWASFKTGHVNNCPIISFIININNQDCLGPLHSLPYCTGDDDWTGPDNLIDDDGESSADDEGEHASAGGPATTKFSKPGAFRNSLLGRVLGAMYDLVEQRTYHDVTAATAAGREVHRAFTATRELCVCW